VNLFAYGTLMDEKIMARAGGCWPGNQAATLMDHRRHALVGRSYPAIVAQEGARVEGICYFDLPEAAWELLDYFEDELYERKQVLVTMEDGSTRPAETYVCKPEYHHLLEEADWSFEDFLNSHKAQFEQEYDGFEPGDDTF
jgi:gamma-glutamylcyclotransferase (GGCT)/AIG2-like uncharacterized protein YtfP